LMREPGKTGVHHDKVYFIQIVDVSERDGAYPAEPTFNVPFQYGKREWMQRDNLIKGYKVKNVSLPIAQKAYNKMVKEKDRKGYLKFDDLNGLTVWNQLVYE